MNVIDVFGDEVGEGEDFDGCEEGGGEFEGVWGEEVLDEHLWRGMFIVGWKKLCMKIWLTNTVNSGSGKSVTPRALFQRTDRHRPHSLPQLEQRSWCMLEVTGGLGWVELGAGAVCRRAAVHDADSPFQPDTLSSMRLMPFESIASKLANANFPGVSREQEAYEEYDEVYRVGQLRLPENTLRRQLLGRASMATERTWRLVRHTMQNLDLGGANVNYNLSLNKE